MKYSENKIWTVTHHAIIEWMLNKHCSFARWYVICTFPGLAFIMRNMYFPEDGIMVYHTLEDQVNYYWVNLEADMNASQSYRRKRTTELVHCRSSLWHVLVRDQQQMRKQNKEEKQALTTWKRLSCAREPCRILYAVESLRKPTCWFGRKNNKSSADGWARSRIAAMPA